MRYDCLHAVGVYSNSAYSSPRNRRTSKLAAADDPLLHIGGFPPRFGLHSLARLAEELIPGRLGQFVADFLQIGHALEAEVVSVAEGVFFTFCVRVRRAPVTRQQGFSTLGGRFRRRPRLARSSKSYVGAGFLPTAPVTNRSFARPSVHVIACLANTTRLWQNTPSPRAAAKCLKPR